MDTHFTLDQPLRAVGEILERRGDRAAIVVVGGTALNLLGVVERFTRDVDVIAIATPNPKRQPREIRPPDPLPNSLRDAVQTVTRDLRLPADWLNTTVAMQWKTGLPPGFATRVHWERYAGLWVGLADRLDLIHLKLYAAADDVGPQSRHFQDLVALAPTAAELSQARAWIKTQDRSPEFADSVDQVIAHVPATGR
jgi:hypothetical protein